MSLKNLRKPTHATVVAYLALFVAVTGAGGAAYAATGGSFILGKSNSANAATSVTRTTTGPAISANVRAGSAPLAVNSRTKVTKLNSDLLDGRDSTYFQKKLATRLTFTALTMQNGWSDNCFGTGTAGVAKSVDGVVHLHGGICASAPASNLAFTLPSAFRPSMPVYLTADMCDSSTGRLLIDTDGTVSVQSDANPPASFTSTASECFTSLAGISFTLPY